MQSLTFFIATCPKKDSWHELAVRVIVPNWYVDMFLEGGDRYGSNQMESWICLMLEEGWDLRHFRCLSSQSRDEYYETENAIVAEVALPGIPENDVDRWPMSYHRQSAVSESEDKDNRRYWRRHGIVLQLLIPAPENIAKSEPEGLEHGVLTFLPAWKSNPLLQRKFKVTAKRQKNN